MAAKGGWKKNSDFSSHKRMKILIIYKISSSSQSPELHLYLVPDSYSRPQTRESVESAKKWLEYESFEYESRLDTPLVDSVARPSG